MASFKGETGGFKFRRQHSIGNYIVDFICLERKLIIELDGGQHTMPEIEAYDKERDDWLDEEGYRILRFWDNDVLQNINGIIEIMKRSLSGTPSPSSPPLQGGAMKRAQASPKNQTISRGGVGHGEHLFKSEFRMQKSEVCIFKSSLCSLRLCGETVSGLWPVMR